MSESTDFESFLLETEESIKDQDGWAGFDAIKLSENELIQSTGPDCLEGDYKLTEVYHGDCLTSNPSNFSAFMLHICTLNNQMMFQLSTNRNIFGSEHADRFMDIFKTSLEKSVI